MRIKGLPQTRRWNEVVARIGLGESAPEVAEATLAAAEKAFNNVSKDWGFRQATCLLVELALIGNSPEKATLLSELGIEIRNQTSLAEVAVQISQELDRRIDTGGRRTDFGEMAQLAMVSALVDHVEQYRLPLFPLSDTEVMKALTKLSNPKDFGKVARKFCSNLTDRTLSYFLSKTLATHVGEKQRFSTTNQVSQFEEGMRCHCQEASGIMEQFAAEWFSKRRYLGGGEISSDAIDRFGWFGMQKMRAELVVRAKRDE